MLAVGNMGMGMGTGDATRVHYLSTFLVISHSVSSLLSASLTFLSFVAVHSSIVGHAVGGKVVVVVVLDSSKSVHIGNCPVAPPMGSGLWLNILGLFWVCSEVRVVWWLCPSPLEYLCFASS